MTTDIVTSLLQQWASEHPDMETSALEVAVRIQMAATDISNEAMLTTGAMTTRIDGLEKRGLLRRRKSPKDGRSVLVRLSLKGRRLIDNAVDTRLDDANEALASLDASERANLVLMLRKLGSLLES
jgi:DNA-binding MarR family transcriptional regulator